MLCYFQETFPDTTTDGTAWYNQPPWFQWLGDSYTPNVPIEGSYDDGFDDYERDLRRRQREHLDRVRCNTRGYSPSHQRCLHDGCPQCLGTGVRDDGSSCVHHLACPCPKCSPHC